MPIAEYEDWDGIALAALVAKKKLSPLELVDEAIRRAEALNPKINAVVHATFERAREHARGRLPDGPFRGVPFFLKDILGATTEAPTRQGSAFIPDVPSPHDSELVRRFRASGAISLGKTNVPEFGLIPTTESRLYGPARNPWNLAHSAGGSSGGSAAAVAARIVPFAHANDGGGSIRIPASACGLVGLKPTRGRNPLGPDLGDVMNGLVGDHIVSRSVRDTAVMLDAVSGPDLGDPYAAPPPVRPYAEELKGRGKKLRVAFTLRSMQGGKFHPDVTAAVKHAARLCAELGHDVSEDSPQFEDLTMPFMAIWSSGLAMLVDGVGMMTMRTPRQGDFEGLTWGLYQMGKSISAAQYQMAWFQIQRQARAIAQWHRNVDVFLTPTLGQPPLELGVVDTSETDVMKAFAPIISYVPYTAVQNATGQPALNLPLFWNKAGLPTGVQFVGRFGEEGVLIRLAAQLEKAAPWAHRKPKLVA